MILYIYTIYSFVLSLMLSEKAARSSHLLQYGILNLKHNILFSLFPIVNINVNFTLDLSEYLSCFDFIL